MLLAFASWRIAALGPKTLGWWVCRELRFAGAACQQTTMDQVDGYAANTSASYSRSNVELVDLPERRILFVDLIVGKAGYLRS
jgi:hypothetical protein